VSDVGRAIEQIAEIHEHLAKGEIYRGWRSVPVASSGVVGLAAAAWQSASLPAGSPWSFTVYWLAVGSLALLVGCSEITWHFVARANATERRRSLQVIGQFLPALVAGALVTGALVRLSPDLAKLLPGLWALFFGVGIFSARPYMPRASGWVALYYWTAGLLLLWFSGGMAVWSPWAVGGTFGAGQLFAAGVLYWNLERGTRGIDR
jgi:hypothetical protein